ncbi:hypothetical protein RHSIM_Rhsim06G0180500 [Rhododendron simsii]|uniref:Uncharacterized protein n=1 Tax=Rhododendron simsii TaxID=118357 RepID=A0A834GU86_RHOSS|nr:hypothetical protein RHSIM_Rhsim06G0180500 [Rhododendron simsii]
MRSPKTIVSLTKNPHHHKSKCIVNLSNGYLFIKQQCRQSKGSGLQVRRETSVDDSVVRPVILLKFDAISTMYSIFRHCWATHNFLCAKSIQKLHQSPVQCQHFRRLQPFQGRLPARNQPQVRRNHGPNPQALPFETAHSSLFRRPVARPHKVPPLTAVEGKRSGRTGLQQPSQRRSLRVDAEKEPVLPVPERVQSCQPEASRGNLRRVRARADFGRVRPPVERCLELEGVFGERGGQDIPNLKTILMGISQSLYLRLHRRVKQVQRHFVIDGTPKRFDIFHMIVHSIWLRRLNVLIQD